jgi:hypothetical protein
MHAVCQLVHDACTYLKCINSNHFISFCRINKAEPRDFKQSKMSSINIYGVQAHTWSTILDIIGIIERFGNVNKIKMSGSHLKIYMDSYLSAMKGKFYLEKIKLDKDLNIVIKVDNPLLYEVDKVCDHFSDLV